MKLLKNTYIDYDYDTDEFFFVRGKKREKLTPSAVSYLENQLLMHLSKETNKGMRSAIDKGEVDITENANYCIGRAGLPSGVPEYEWMTLSVAFIKQRKVE